MEEKRDLKSKLQASKKNRDKTKKLKKPKKPIEDENFDDDDDEMDVEPGLEFNKIYDPKNADMDEEEGEWEDDEEDLQVDFEFYDPHPNQMMSVKALINGYMDGLSFRSSELAEMIVSQPVVGTMIGVEDEEETKKNGDKDVMAVATLLNIDHYKQKQVIKEILNYVVQASTKHNSEHEKLYNILDKYAAKTLLLINERVVNLSPQLIPMLQKEVLEDLKWVAENNVPESPQFQFEYVLALSKCYKDAKGPAGKKMNSGFQYEDFGFPKFEDFEFLKNAEISFTFPARASKNASGLTLLNKEESDSESWHRIVYLISREKYIASVGNLSSYIDESI